MTRTVLITAGAYIEAELAAEFGRLPPSFLPVGNRRLFSRQADVLRGAFDRILMSLPADFAVSPQDEALIGSLGIELLRTAPGLSLSQAILQCIAEGAVDDGALAILHGDTLIFDIDLGVADSVSVGETSDFYSWAGFALIDERIARVFDHPPGGSDEVLSGFFHFADLHTLVLSLAASNGRFVAALDRYARARPLVPLRSDRWLDFGHTHTYYASRSLITTERAFNALSVVRRSISKSSAKAGRIAAETHWYETVPQELRLYLPQYLGRLPGEQSGYQLEFLYMASLADLFVFGSLPERVWARIFDAVDEFLDAASFHRAPADGAAQVMDMYLAKTEQRLRTFAEANAIDLERGWTINGVATPGLIEIARRVAAAIPPPRPDNLSVVHGDLCFSNILYDFRSQSIRAIDPRGEDAAGRATIWGDNRYDLAKLHHSAIGGYDLILAGYADLQDAGAYELSLTLPQSPSVVAAREAFETFLGLHRPLDAGAVRAISVLLFLSMLPLHDDAPTRQRALLANGLRLFAEMEPAA